MKIKNFTKKQLQAARVYAAESSLDCAKHCFDGDFGFASHVTLADKIEYCEEHIATAREILAGEKDGNLGVAQSMTYFLTGECHAILP